MNETVEIRLATYEDRGSISVFIANMNRKKVHHIGYCGTGRQEIERSLLEDFTDVAYQHSFVLAWDREQLIGVVGLDMDLEDNSAEVWGPFIVDSHKGIIYELWQKMMQNVPKEVHSLYFFPNKRNTRVYSFIEDLGYTDHSEQLILLFDGMDIQHLTEKQNPFIELSQSYFGDMIGLHDRTFPDTYYDGKHIIERINENRKVFIHLEEETFAGYIYVEVEPEFEEASIEYFAVDETKRGRGIGKQLIETALRWIFDSYSIESLTLCVNANNRAAIQLYQKAGFRLLHELDAYTVQLK